LAYLPTTWHLTPTSSLARSRHVLQAASSSSIWSKCHTPAFDPNNVRNRGKHRRSNDAAVFSKILTVAFADSSQLRHILRDLLDGVNLSYKFEVFLLSKTHNKHISIAHAVCYMSHSVLTGEYGGLPAPEGIHSQQSRSAEDHCTL